MNKPFEKKSLNRVFRAGYTLLLFTLIFMLFGLFALELSERYLFVGLDRGVSLYWYVPALVICLFAGANLQVVLHEYGHYLCGRMSGYTFVSFRIFSAIFLRVEGRLRMRRFKISGTGGQCLMMPPERDAGGHFPYRLYLLGGVLMNILCALLALLLMRLLPPTVILSDFLSLFSLVGLIFALTNGLPAHYRGVANDGQNLLSLAQDEAGREGFYLQLSINARLTAGTRLRDMPADWFRMPERRSLSNPLVAAVGYFVCAYYQDKGEHELARRACQYLLGHGSGLLPVQLDELRCELLYYAMLDGNRSEVETMMMNTRDHIRATGRYPSRQRLLFTHALLIDRDRGLADRYLLAFSETSRDYPFEAELERERELIALAEETARQRAEGGL